MKVLSVNVGQTRQVIWKGQEVVTGIFKSPVNGPVVIHRLNVAGDQQADLRVHGGVDKAVYAYPSEHYPYWQDQYPAKSIAYAMFGENLTTTGLVEEEVWIGDVFRVGEAVLQVSQPRIPCYKLGIRFDDASIVKAFLESRRSGIYFRVLEEGNVEAGSAISLVGQDSHGLSVADVVRLYAFEKDDLEGLTHAIDHPALTVSWRDHFLGQYRALLASSMRRDQ
jgi:MOSC domain-containing protein YiiM